MNDPEWKQKELKRVRWAARRDDGSFPETVELLHRVHVPHDYQYSEKAGDLPDREGYDILISRADGHVIMATGVSGIQQRASCDWLIGMYLEYFPALQQAHILRRRILGQCIAAYRHAEILYENAMGLPDQWDGRRSSLGQDEMDVDPSSDQATLALMMNIMPNDSLAQFRRIERMATPEQMEIVMRHVFRVLNVAGMEIAALSFRGKADPDAARMTEEEIDEESIRVVDEVDRMKRERAEQVRRLERLATMRDGIDNLRDELDATRPGTGGDTGEG